MRLPTRRGRHDRRRRGVVAFELGIRRVGIAERVELPFLVGRLRTAGADGRLERRLVLVEDRDDVVQRLAVAHGVVGDQGIGRCRQSSLLWLSWCEGVERLITSPIEADQLGRIGDRVAAVLPEPLAHLPGRVARPVAGARGRSGSDASRCCLAAVVASPFVTVEAFFWACSNRMALSAISMIGASWIWLMRSAGMPLANRNLPSSS